MRRAGDGAFILSHDEPPVGVLGVKLQSALDTGHALQLDLKEPGFEVELLTNALSQLAADRIVLTTAVDESIRIAKERFPEVSAGLTLGERPSARTWRRVERCHADFIALDHRYERWYRDTPVPVWLWTVDDEPTLKRYIDSGKAEAIITNRPDLALRLRKDRS